MNKKEISEIKKLFTTTHCAVTRICGCYVDAEKNQKTKLKEAFLSLPEEEMFKYFNIFRKSLSGTLGKNLVQMEFPLEQEASGGTQEFLLQLRNSQPAITWAPASDEIYDHILCSICPVKLSKPGLHYNADANTIENLIQDWIVEAPDIGFLFPAFTDRNTDIHNLMYYSKKPDVIQTDIINNLLGCRIPLSAKTQKETFQTIIEETLDNTCDFETVMAIQENLNEMIEERKEDPEPLTLDKYEVKRLLADSGVENEKLEEFDDLYASVVSDEQAGFVASNVASTRSYEIRTPDVIIKVSPDKAQLIESKVIDGIPYLMIQATDQVEINGIAVKSPLLKENSEMSESEISESEENF